MQNRLLLKARAFVLGLIGLMLVSACEPLFRIGDKPRRTTLERDYPGERSDWIMKTYATYLKKSASYNKKVFVFVDYRKDVTERRFYIVYPQKDVAYAYKVAHGYGSDPNEDGHIDLVGDRKDHGQSSEGVFLVTGSGSSKKFTRKLLLSGLSKSNRMAAIRNILVHPALRDKKDYLNAKKCSGGCFAVNVSVADEIMDAIGQPGTLIIASFTDLF